MSISSSYVALIILQHYGSGAAEMEGFTREMDNLWSTCENLVKCAWIFAFHLNPSLNEVVHGCTDVLLGETLIRLLWSLLMSWDPCLHTWIFSFFFYSPPNQSLRVGRFCFISACFAYPQAMSESGELLLFCYSLNGNVSNQGVSNSFICWIHTRMDNALIQMHSRR